MQKHSIIAYVHGARQAENRKVTKMMDGWDTGRGIHLAIQIKIRYTMMGTQVLHLCCFAIVPMEEIN